MVGLTHLPPLFNMFGMQQPWVAPTHWVAQNSGRSGLEGGREGGRGLGRGHHEKRGGGERVERSVVQQVGEGKTRKPKFPFKVVPWNMMYFSPMLRG